MQNYNSFINEEVGIRNIKEIIGDMRTAEIYFHKDLDGVTSALAMKYFLETYYQVKTVDAHQIQYGGMEFAIKNHKEGNLTVLVDFAHGKGAKFKIQSDHHDKQVGADKQGTYFKPARSNVEIISGEISYSPAFTSGDVELIRTVDSANFLIYNITPKDIQNSIFQFKRELSGEKNRFMMGFVVNRLLLAYKNKRISVKSMDGQRDHINRNILECMVLDCSPSLLSIYNNIRHYINNARVSDRAGVLAKPEVLMQNLTNYIERMKNYRFIEDPDTGDVSEFDPNSSKHKFLSSVKGAKVGKGVHFDDKHKILIQYGAGNMIQPGSYDRYVTYENFPNANFMCIIWPMGLIQVSCNPFKEKMFKDINLGGIAKEVIAKHQPILTKILVSLDCLKKEFETSQDWKKMQKEEGPDYVGVGFKYSDLKAFYVDCIFKTKDGEIKNSLNKLGEITVISVDEVFQNIKVSIDVDNKKYIFGIKEISKIKKFTLDVQNGQNLEEYSNRIGEINPFSSELSEKQVGGAKDKIKNSLESDGFIVTSGSIMKVFQKMEGEEILADAMDTIYDKLSTDQLSTLKEYKIPVWELITRNSGGHPSITNIQGWGFLKYNKDAAKVAYGTEKYTEIMKKVAREFVDNLKDKVESFEQGKAIKYDTKGVEFTGQDTNENYKSNSIDIDKSYVKSGITINNDNRRIILKFENFRNK